MNRRWLAPAVVVLALTLAACGGSAADSGGPTFDLPTATSLGGPVLSSPRVQPIYFSGFPYGPDIDRFLAALQTSRYWAAATAEYGVGPLTVSAGFAATATVPATVTSDALDALLTDAFHALEATAPIRGDTIYALFFDPATAFSLSGVTLCGQGPSGFHDEVQYGSLKVPMAVLPTCGGSQADSTLTGVNALTPALSHELIEAATDPYVSSNPAYLGIDDAHALWAVALSGSEVGDLCENEVPSLVQPSDLGFPVQRIWSNASARAGTGPCVPVPAGERYFNAQAEMAGQAPFHGSSNQMITVPALDAAVGQTVSARVSLRGQRDDSSTVGVFAVELDNAGAPLTGHPMLVSGRLGQSISVSVAPATAGKTGVAPLVVAAGTRDAIHFWVGAIDRR